MESTINNSIFLLEEFSCSCLHFYYSFIFFQFLWISCGFPRLRLLSCLFRSYRSISNDRKNSHVNLSMQLCQSKGKYLTLMEQDERKMAGGNQVQ